MKDYNIDNDDSNKLQVYEWDNIEHARAIICIVHGMGEHALRYDHVASFLNEHEYHVVAYDQKGHGKSYGKRGHIDQLNDYLEDLELILDQIKTNHPNSKIVLYGHSMGGNVVANYLIQKKQDINAAVITSPLLKLSFEPPKSKVFLAKTMSKIYGAFSENTKLEVKHISRDQEVVNKYINDPLVHSKMTASTFVSLIEAGTFAIENGSKIRIPTLVYHGDDDQITSHKASEDFAEKSDFIHFKSWAGLYHETHNAPEKEEVFGYLVNWINKTLEF